MREVNLYGVYEVDSLMLKAHAETIQKISAAEKKIDTLPSGIDKLKFAR